MKMENKINLNIVFNILNEIIEFNHLEKYLIDKNEREVCIFDTSNAFGITIVKFNFPFLMLYVENNEVAFHTTNFESENQVKDLLNSFINGQYNYNLKFEVLCILNWRNPLLSKFNLECENVTLQASIGGYDWTKKS